MALKVWLPLNGNLENKGISDITVTNNGATVDNNGKIGKCYSFNGVDDRIYSTTANLNNQEASYTCWVKITSYKQYGFTFSLGDVKANTSQMSCYIHHTNHNVYICCNGSELNSGFLMPLNEWHHLCFTYKNTESKLYIDGTLRYTGTNAGNYKTSHNLTLGARSNSANGAGSSFSYPMEGYMNDFRIYDHCLSALEVKEISQGLILHYKLDGFNGGVGENLAIGTNTASISTNVFNQSNQTGGISKEIVYDNGIPCVKITRNNTAQSGWKFFSYNNFLRNNIKTSTQYTVSFDIKASVNGTIGFTGLVQSNATNYMTKSISVEQGTVTQNVWSHIILHCITKDSFSDITIGSQIIYMSPSASLVDIGVSYLLKNMKFEEGENATSWTPAISELGIDTTKIKDSSGYENDGFLVNGTNETGGANNGRYQVCTNLLGTTVDSTSNTITGAQYLYAPFKMPAWTAITVAWWGNNIAYGRGGIFETTGTTGNIWEGSDYNTTAIANWDSTFGIFNGSTRVNIFNNFIKDSTWHHHAITFDGANVKYYCDSVLKQTSALTGTLPAITGFKMGLGRAGGVYRQIKQKLNDVRIYVTALSAEDIKKLYQTPTEIDKNGSWHTHEFYENGENFITKNGLIKDCASSEYPFTQHLKYDPEIYFEPDGSAWVHIYHHNNPGAGSFASSNTFANSCYIDENRWFNATEICNQFNKWEFLVKYAFTSGGVEYKERWIQTKNPEDAVFADVDAADITRITGNGYKTGTWGGLYKKNNSAYWVMNNGNSGNWWGATGSFSVYQSGIPGYGGTVTTTGYNDLYIRIDDIDFNQVDKAWITKSNIYLGNSLIEK